MIFELPNVPFPETHPIAQMEAYDELRGYLHARSLRWSAGAMKGRPEALWPQRNGLDPGYEEGQASLLINRRIALRLPPQALSTLTFAGFSGIYIDRQGFWDLGASIISQLQSLLGEAPIESEDGRFAFFNLSTFAKKLHQKYSPEQWEAQRRKTLELSPSKG